jgi:hypothetical protein
MINRPTTLSCIAFSASCPASVALRQTRELFGPTLPMVCHEQGGRHRCLHGYYGPFDPTMGPKSDYTAVVCLHEPPGRLWLPSARTKRSGSGKARDQADAAK